MRWRRMTDNRLHTDSSPSYYQSHQGFLSQISFESYVSSMEIESTCEGQYVCSPWTRVVALYSLDKMSWSEMKKVSKIERRASDYGQGPIGWRCHICSFTFNMAAMRSPPTPSIRWYLGQENICAKGHHPKKRESKNLMFQVCLGLHFLSSTSMPSSHRYIDRYVSNQQWRRHGIQSWDAQVELDGSPSETNIKSQSEKAFARNKSIKKEQPSPWSFLFEPEKPPQKQSHNASKLQRQGQRSIY